MRFYGITGTPGTGKKSIAPLVANTLGIPHFSLNKIASDLGLIDEEEVDTSLLAEEIRKINDKALLYGHLLPLVLKKMDVIHVVVLRCEPSILKERLYPRGYEKEKVMQNLEAEFIGLIAYQCYSRFGLEKVSEFDTTNQDPKEASMKVANILLKKEKTKRIEWPEHYKTEEKFRLLFSS
jgi:adenylate kinase